MKKWNKELDTLLKKVKIEKKHLHTLKGGGVVEEAEDMGGID